MITISSYRDFIYGFEVQLLHLILIWQVKREPISKLTRNARTGLTLVIYDGQTTPIGPNADMNELNLIPTNTEVTNTKI